MKWVVDVNQEINFIPDTEAVVSLALQEQDLWVGQSSIYNTNKEGAFQRYKYTSYSNSNSNFSYARNRGAGMLGNSHVYT